MSTLKFQIRHPNGHVEHLTVDGEARHDRSRRPLRGSACPSISRRSRPILIQQTGAAIYAKSPLV